MTVRVALVGTRFGAAFLPVWRAHPDASVVAVCRRDRRKGGEVAREYGIGAVHGSLDAVLADPGIDAVHLCTPVLDHGRQAAAALRAGKHVLCSVPLAVTAGELARIVAGQRNSGLVCMLAETAVYSREFAYVESLARDGVLGRMQFGTACHLQDTETAKPYWRDVAPMLYSSHLAAPLLALAGTPAVSVTCLSTATGQPYPAPGFAFQSCLVSTGPEGPVLTLTRGAGRVSRPWLEGFSVYGERASFEWPRTSAERPLVFTAGAPVPAAVPDHGAGLPEQLRPFTRNGPHGGSYAPIVHDFVTAVRTGRPCRAGIERAVEWTAVGLAAHESSAAGGRPTPVPTVDDLCRPDQARRP